MKSKMILVVTSILMAGLVPWAAARAGARQPGDGQGFDGAVWRRALDDPDLDVREREFGRLVERARTSPEARTTLREWADGDGDLAWTSRLALRELALRAERIGTAHFGPPDALQRLPGRFGDPSRGPGADPWADLWRPRGDPFEEFLGRFGDLLDGGLPAGSAQRSESFRMESTPDGVKVEVRENEDGDEHVQTYEAETLDELFESHPELRGRIDVAPRLDRRHFDDLFDRFWRPSAGARPGSSVPTDRLGILMREPDSGVVPRDGVDADAGLRVERVLPGSLAAALGIRPGDIVTELNGAPLRRAEDVREVLSKHVVGDTITAVVVDPRGNERELEFTDTPRRSRRDSQV